MKVTVLGVAAAALLSSVTLAPAADSFESMRLERLHPPGDDAPAAPRRQRPIRVVRSAPVRLESVTRAPAGAVAGLFSVKEGADLEGTLRGWAQRDGFTVLWKSQYAYEINSDATFSGNLIDAIKALSWAMRDVRPAPTVDIYMGNHTVVVSNSGTTQTD